MSGSTLLVIADPSASFLKGLARVPGNVRVVVSDDPAKLNEAAPEADAILYAGGNAGLLTGVLPHAPRVRWIHSLWTGVEGILTPEMLAHPAQLTNGRGVFRWPLADWVVAVMLHFSFDLGRVIRQQQAGVWQNFISETLEGRTLGIIGYGSIGSAAAARAKGFGMKIAALKRKTGAAAGPTNDGLVDQYYSSAQLHSLIAASDYLLLATPITAETRGMIGTAEIAAMKSSAVLINVGRGAVVDEAALIQALGSGKIRGAALDVFTVEPLPGDHPFYRMTNVLVSPHTADRVEGFLGPPIEAFLENLQRFLKDESLECVVNKHAGYETHATSVVSFEDIREASLRIRPIAKRTPVMTSRGFNAASGIEAFFKCENLQTGGAFKIRGASNFVSRLSPEQLKYGVVAYSSGNHAQAVALAARAWGAKATLVMPLDSPRSKVEATRAQGARIVTYDRLREDRTAIGKRIAEETGAALIPPFDHPWTIGGQGTTALELMEELPDLDALVVPVGGGGLISGCSIAAKHLRPDIRVIGVEPTDGNDTFLSLAAGKRVEIPPPESIADGLRSPAPGELTFPIIQRNVERVVLVTDAEIREAMKFLLARMKILVEPSGAVTAAAALSGKLPKELGRTGLIISGGNVDLEMLAELS